jgi:hypothetical protein
MDTPPSDTVACGMGHGAQICWKRCGRVPGIAAAQPHAPCTDAGEWKQSRVVYQSKNERNFHVFYQVLRSDDAAIRMCAGGRPPYCTLTPAGDAGALGITGAPNDYRYTSQSGCFDVPDMDDRADHKEVKAAMKVIGFHEDDITGIYRLVAGILHLGNINFDADEKDNAVVRNKKGASLSATRCRTCVLTHAGARFGAGGQELWVQRRCAAQGADLAHGQGLVQVRQGRRDAADGRPGSLLARRSGQVGV